MEFDSDIREKSKKSSIREAKQVTVSIRTCSITLNATETLSAIRPEKLPCSCFRDYIPLICPLITREVNPVRSYFCLY